MAENPQDAKENQETGWLHRLEVGMEGLARGVFIGIPTGSATLVDWGAIALNNAPRLFGAGKISENPVLIADWVESRATNVYDGVNELTGYQPPQLLDTTDHVIAGVANFAGSVLVPGTALTKAGVLPNVFKAAATGAKGFFGANLTRGGAMMWSAAPTIAVAGALAAEYHTGGALSEAAIDAGVGVVKAAAESDIFSAETLDMAVDGVGYFNDVFSALDKSVQNQVVKATMKNPDNPDANDIKNGKRAATLFVLQPDNLVAIGVKMTARAAVADDLYKGNREEADKYLAREFIDNVLKIAKVRALGDNQVTEADLKAVLPEAMKSGKYSSVVPDRLENGLRLLWPESFAPSSLYGKPKEEAENEPNGFFSAPSLGKAFGQAGKGAPQEQESASLFDLPILRDLKNNSLIGGLIFILEKVAALFNHYIKPLFKSALGGNLLVQGGTDRLSRVMANNGQAMPQGARISVVGHDAEGPEQEEAQDMVLAAGGTVPQFRPALDVR